MKKDIKLQLANRIRHLREKRGYTQHELAEKAGIDYKHVQRLEGKNPPAVRIDTLAKIAKALNVSLKELV